MYTLVTYVLNTDRAQPWASCAACLTLPICSQRLPFLQAVTASPRLKSQPNRAIAPSTIEPSCVVSCLEALIAASVAYDRKGQPRNVEVIPSTVSFFALRDTGICTSPIVAPQHTPPTHFHYHHVPPDYYGARMLFDAQRACALPTELPSIMVLYVIISRAKKTPTAHPAATKTRRKTQGPKQDSLPKYPTVCKPTLGRTIHVHGSKATPDEVQRSQSTTPPGSKRPPTVRAVTCSVSNPFRAQGCTWRAQHTRRSKQKTPLVRGAFPPPS